jgi:hypothetical protein
MQAGFGSNPAAAQTGYEARSLSSAFIHACMNNHGAVRSKRYHAVSTFKYMSAGIIVPVNRSTIGYFKSVTVDASPRFRRHKGARTWQSRI